MPRILLIFFSFLIFSAASGASLKPQVPPQERAVYEDMLKTNPTAAKQYLATREYVSTGRQVVANPKLAIDLPDEPDDCNWRYATKDEQKIMKQAIQMALSAYIRKKGGL
jgi:hypothetical protein